MSGHVETEVGFKARAMVDPQEGTVHSLTTRETGKKRGKFVSTSVRVISEEQYKKLIHEYKRQSAAMDRAVSTLNELAIDHDRTPHMPRGDPLGVYSSLDRWNEFCDDTIVRHHERGKALISYRESELGREQIRKDGGISRAILNVIEELEAVLQTRLNRKASPRIEHLSEAEETVITIRIPEGAKSHIPMNLDER